MAGLHPPKRREFVRRLRALGFEGQDRQTIPSNADYSVPQLKMLLRQVETVLGRRIPLDEWNGL